jgi:hypothetical protein
VKDLFGLKIQNDRKLDAIRKAMLEELEPEEKPARKSASGAAAE